MASVLFPRRRGLATPYAFPMIISVGTLMLWNTAVGCVFQRTWSKIKIFKKSNYKMGNFTGNKEAITKMEILGIKDAII